MFWNNLNITLRNFVKNKFYSLVNILSLALGLACVFYILLYIHDELTYDKHHEKYERIYRLESDFTISERHDQAAKTSFAIGPTFLRDFPQVEAFVRFREAGNSIIRYGDKVFYEDYIFYADSSVFDIFTHQFIHGTGNNALTEPNTIVLSETFAKKYFGDENPMGEIISIQDGLKCKVTGVVEDLPDNSHLKFNALISMISYGQIIGQDVFNDLETRQFWAIRLFTYILLKENSDISEILKKYPAFNKTYIEEISIQLNGTLDLMVHRLDQIHLHTNLIWDLPTGNPTLIYVFLMIAIFILIIASINYMNLATARSAEKAKEVGVRKVVGAYRHQLIKLFLIESVLFSIAALFVAVLLCELFLSAFNELTSKELSIDIASKWMIYIIMLLLATAVGLLSGSYPSFYLSSFLPVTVLKGRINTGRNSGRLRRGLIIFQFTISVTMIISTLIISSQMRFISKMNLGYNTEDVYYANIRDTSLLKKMESLKHDLQKIPEVVNVSSAENIMGQGVFMDVMLVETDEKMQEQLVGFYFIDHDYVDLMKIKLLQGRNFDLSNETDVEEAILINEAAVREFGWKNNPIGKRIERRNPVKNYKVVGVVKDFHFSSLHEEIEPMTFVLNNEPNSYLHLKIEGWDTKNSLNEVEKIWTQFNPSHPFIYHSLDEAMAELYIDEKKLLSIIGFFSVLSIFIAVLGLFSLSSFMTEQYAKEIGIRKVLGSSVANVFLMLSRKFMFLVIISNIIAWPIAYFAMQRMLNSYAYRTSIAAWMFVTAGAAAIIVALLTVCIKIIRAASANPIDSLRYE